MKKVTQIVAAVLSVITVFAFTSCGRENQDQTIDKSKLQLYVKYYNGGFGDEWLKKLGSEFEATFQTAAVSRIRDITDKVFNILPVLAVH